MSDYSQDLTPAERNGWNASMPMPHFDELPPAGVWWVRLKRLAVLLFTIGYAGFVTNIPYSWWLLLPLSIVLFLVLSMSRLVMACLRHTRFTLLELLLLSFPSSLLFGFFFMIYRTELRDPVHYVLCAAGGSLLLSAFWHCVFVGMRLAMWMQPDGAPRRTGFLLLGILGWPSHLLWKILLPLGTIFWVIGWWGKEPYVLKAGAIGLPVGSLCLGLAWVHQHFRRIAQARYEREPMLHGPSGDLRSYQPAPVKARGLASLLG